MYDKIYEIIQSADDFVWGWGMIALLLGTHLFLTVRTGFIQRKTITKGIRLSVAKEEGADGEVSQFGALATALASTIGTGNIIGVGTAIALGGPGAVFWCWITGIFGIATKYAESLIAVKVLAAQLVQGTDDIGDLHLLTVNGSGNTLFKGHGHIFTLIGSLLGSHTKYQQMLVVRLVAGIFQFQTFVADVPDITVTAVGRIGGERKMNAMSLAVLNLSLT